MCTSVVGDIEVSTFGRRGRSGDLASELRRRGHRYVDPPLLSVLLGPWPWPLPLPLPPFFPWWSEGGGSTSFDCWTTGVGDGGGGNALVGDGGWTEVVLSLTG